MDIHKNYEIYRLVVVHKQNNKIPPKYKPKSQIIYIPCNITNHVILSSSMWIQQSKHYKYFSKMTQNDQNIQNTT